MNLLRVLRNSQHTTVILNLIQNQLTIGFSSHLVIPTLPEESETITPLSMNNSHQLVLVERTIHNIQPRSLHSAIAVVGTRVVVLRCRNY